MPELKPTGGAEAEAGKPNKAGLQGEVGQMPRFLNTAAVCRVAGGATTTETGEGPEGGEEEEAQQEGEGDGEEEQQGEGLEEEGGEEEGGEEGVEEEEAA